MPLVGWKLLATEAGGLCLAQLEVPDDAEVRWSEWDPRRPYQRRPCASKARAFELKRWAGGGRVDPITRPDTYMPGERYSSTLVLIADRFHAPISCSEAVVLRLETEPGRHRWASEVPGVAFSAHGMAYVPGSVVSANPPQHRIVFYPVRYFASHGMLREPSLPECLRCGADGTDHLPGGKCIFGPGMYI